MHLDFKMDEGNVDLRDVSGRGLSGVSTISTNSFSFLKLCALFIKAHKIQGRKRKQECRRFNDEC